jgi:hypothetical protein
VLLPTHWIAERKASAACLWLIAAILVVQLFVTADRGLVWPVPGQSNRVSVLNSTPAPASAHDILQIIDPEVWRRTARPKPDAQAKTPIALAALSDPVVAHEPGTPPVREPGSVVSNRPPPFHSRAPPLPVAAL